MFCVLDVGQVSNLILSPRIEPEKKEIKIFVVQKFSLLKHRNVKICKLLVYDLQVYKIYNIEYIKEVIWQLFEVLMALFSSAVNIEFILASFLKEMFGCLHLVNFINTYFICISWII